MVLSYADLVKAKASGTSQQPTDHHAVHDKNNDSGNPLGRHPQGTLLPNNDKVTSKRPSVSAPPWNTPGQAQRAPMAWRQKETSRHTEKDVRPVKHVWGKPVGEPQKKEDDPRSKANLGNVPAKSMTNQPILSQQRDSSSTKPKLVWGKPVLATPSPSQQSSSAAIATPEAAARATPGAVKIMKRGEEMDSSPPLALVTKKKKKKGRQLKNMSIGDMIQTHAAKKQQQPGKVKPLQPKLVTPLTKKGPSGPPWTGGGPQSHQETTTEARRMDGEEHQLLRLMQERNVYQKKGRQRLAPRKKKFSTLKKKVLQERLEQWRKLHPEDVPASAENTEGSDPTAANSRIVCLLHFTTAEELEDDDEYDEILANFKEMADKVSEDNEVFIPPACHAKDATSHPVFCRFKSLHSAQAALSCWNGLSLAGESIEAIPIGDLDDGTDRDWKEYALEVHASSSQQKSSTDDSPLESMKFLLKNVLSQDDLEDEDCLNETMSDIREKLLSTSLHIVELAPETNTQDVRLILEGPTSEKDNVAGQLRSIVLGGDSLDVELLDVVTFVVELGNVLSEEDLDDDDCLEESLKDLEELASKWGDVKWVRHSGRDVHVAITVASDMREGFVARITSMRLNIGGNIVVPQVAKDANSEIQSLPVALFLSNIVSDDDMEDQECLEESLQDIRKVASQYGNVESLELETPTAGDKPLIRLRFEHRTETMRALEGFQGMVFGGQIVSATLDCPGAVDISSPGPPSGEKRTIDGVGTDESNTKKARTDGNEPLYSGDKLIPERFAEMKRVPKVANTGEPRAYASLSKDERTKPLLQETLAELMRLQKRALEEENKKQKRRLVMGLREVARGIRAHKVKLVVMANNLDQYGAIDEKVQEIIDLATNEGVPIFYEFSKRTLGKAIGKSIKIAVVGIQNADGANQPFKKLLAIANTM